MKNKKVYLTLQNGKVFCGERFGANGKAFGELVFSTGMVGYMETLTDPSNYGKIIVQTFPLIGNYGVINSDVESDKAQVSAYVVRELCSTPSNFRCEGELNEYLKAQNVVGISGVDTRELTKILREEGAMNACISDKKLTQEEIDALAFYKETDVINAITPKTKMQYGDENAKYTLAFWNFGSKKSTLQRFVDEGYKVISLPAYTTAEEILSLNVDGVVLSDGAGDPKDNAILIEEVKKLVGKKPIFAIGLGHQLLALSLGADTKKQKHGHRGSNQPVKCLRCGRVYISTQNHGYVVANESIKQGELKFVNVNDNTCEGIDYDGLNAFGVQFMPESCDVGNVVNPLYKKFLTMIEKENENA